MYIFYNYGVFILDTLEKIVYILKQSNKTQKDLTDYLGVQKTAFTQWKLGKNTSYLKHISKIAEYLNVSADYLLGNSDIKNKPATVNGDELSEDVLRFANKLLLLSEEDLKRVEEYVALLELKGRK